MFGIRRSVSSNAVQLLFTAAFSHGLAGAPFLPTHVDKGEHDGNRQENQWPHFAATATRTMRKGWRNYHPDLPQECEVFPLWDAP